MSVKPHRALVGERFGRLLVTALDGEHRICRCDCGKTTRVTSSNIGRKTFSCGCLWRERITRHGRVKSQEYGIWEGIVGRCTNPSNSRWKDYGGRGIRICDEWRESFSAFLGCVGERPSRQHFIDRFPNNDGHYEPGNVRWATRSEQQRNRRNNHVLTAFDKTQTLTAWAQETGIGVGAIRQRLRYNWPVEVALTLPATRTNRLLHIGRLK